MRPRNRPCGARKCTQFRYHHFPQSSPAKRRQNVQNTDFVIARALAVLATQVCSGCTLTSANAVRDYLRLSLATREYEVFVAILLDAKNRVIAYEELFRGTLTETCVHAREVVKEVLRRNAAAVIFAHNHPSGDAEPSESDELMTQRLKHALALIDVDVLDHFVISGPDIVSFAERGLL